MKITPLVILARMRIPALTDTFSDRLQAASMAVVNGGSTTITCSTAHGLAIGSTVGISIVDAYTPNPITSWSQLANDDVRIVVQYPHQMTANPEPGTLQPWNAYAILSGTGINGFDVPNQLVSVEDRYTFTVRPNGVLTLPPTPPSGANLLERLERELVGWHTATVISTTALSIATPASISRSYTVLDPKICTNVRIAGGVSFDHVIRHYVRVDEKDSIVKDRGWMFIVPRPARLSRDRGARSDAITEIQPGAIVRQLLIDGFEILTILPAEKYGGGVACIDRSHGEVLTAVLRTFNGLRLPYSELATPNPFMAMLESHGVEQYNRANYVHAYNFGVTAYITAEDMVLPTDIPDLAAIDLAIQNGDPLPPSVTPIGAVPIEEITFTPGVYHDDAPQPLEATVILE